MDIQANYDGDKIFWPEDQIQSWLEKETIPLTDPDFLDFFDYEGSSLLLTEK